MNPASAVQPMLYLAAAIQVAAAIGALMLVPLSGMRKSWIVICVALALQAYRRIDAVSTHAGLREAVTALAVSVLLLAGIIGIRSVFVALSASRALLDDQERRAGAVSNRAGAAIVILTLDGRVREANESARVLLRNGDLPIEGLDWFETFVVDGAREEARSTFAKLVSSTDGNDEYVEYPLTDLEGKQHAVVWHRRLLRGANGKPIGVRSVGIDLTEGTTMEKELAFRSILLDHTNDSILVYRLNGSIVYANSTACQYRGVPREEVIGTDVRRFVPVAEQDAFAVHLEMVAQGSSVKVETFATDRDGVVRPLESHMYRVLLGGEQVVVDVSRDITDRREAEAVIRRLAYTDHLTGLANRARMQDRAALSLASARRTGDDVAVLFIDLDRIKTINDTLGHTAGDDLLRQVGERLLALFRLEDTVARIGGDEFVAFTRVNGLADASTVAGRLVESMAEPFAIGGEEVFSSASVGVAIFPDDGEDPEALIAKADAAMYVAKDLGRNRYCGTWNLEGHGRGALADPAGTAD